MVRRLKYIILLLVMAFCLTGCGKEVVVLNDYITYSIDGYNGTGEISFKFDWDSLKSALYDFEDEGFEEKYAALRQNVIFNISKCEDIYNGDLINIGASYSDGIQKLFKGYKFEYEPISISVMGLPDLTYIDIFEGVSITYEGISPNLSVKMDVEMPEGFQLGKEFSISKETGLTVGDRITVTYEGSLEELLDSGYQAQTVTKDYIVDECNLYVLSGEQLDSDYLLNSSEIVGETAYSYAVNNYIDIMKLRYQFVTHVDELNEDGSVPDGYSDFIGQDTVSYAKSCNSLLMNVNGIYLETLIVGQNTSVSGPVNELYYVYEFEYKDKVLGSGSFYIPVKLCNGVIYADTGVDFPLSTLELGEDDITFNKLDIINSLSKGGYSLTEVTGQLKK